jgi:hypothetical protein
VVCSLESRKYFALQGSPNNLVHGELVSKGMPAISDLRAYFKKKA